jgi:hypothetical protein
VFSNPCHLDNHPSLINNPSLPTTLTVTNNIHCLHIFHELPFRALAQASNNNQGCQNPASTSSSPSSSNAFSPSAVANAISEAKANAGSPALAQSIAQAEASGCSSSALANVGLAYLFGIHALICNFSVMFSILI